MAISNSAGEGIIYADNDKYAYSAFVKKNQSCKEFIEIDFKSITLVDHI